MSRLDFNLTDEELGQYTIDMVRCKNCSDLCGFKAARLCEGRPVYICGFRPEGIEVLKRAKARRSKE